MKRNRLAMIGILIASIFFCLTTNTQAQWTTSGNDIYNTNTGNVGIGLNPAVILHIKASNAVATPLTFLRASYNTSGYSTDIQTQFWGGIAGNNLLKFKLCDGTAAGQIEVMTLTGAGNVGIGTASPVAKLEVMAAAHGDKLLTMGSADANFKLNIIPFVIGAGNIGYHFRPYDLGADYTGLTIDSYGKVGVGTTSPGAKLDVMAATHGDKLLTMSSADANFKLNIIPFVIGAGNIGYHFRPYNLGVDYTGLTLDSYGNVGIGTTSPGTYKLAVNGTVRVKEIVASTQGWPDFVFDEDHQPTQLAELERFIKVNKHLPGLPSAKEINANGVQLGEMQAKLLQKVEEMTLYMIDLQKQNDALKQHVNELERKISED